MRSSGNNNINYKMLLGKGKFGEVYLSTIAGINKYFAIKILKKEQMDKPELKKYLNNEKEILKELNHENICKLIDFIETQHHYLLVMECINGGRLSDCFERYKIQYNTPFFPEQIVKYIMTQLISALKYIHSKGIMHRDIRLENIMIQYSSEKDRKDLNLLKAKIKIIDFGLAVKGFGKTILDNPQNMPPLMLKKFLESGASKISKTTTYDQKIDIWELGAICYQMLMGKPVFDGNSLNDLVKKVEEGIYQVPTTLSREIVSFLNCMLRSDPRKRKTAEELSKHPFIAKSITEFHKMNLKKCSKQIANNAINFNIKKTINIWSIFAEEDKIKLSNIKEENQNKHDSSSKGNLPTSSHSNKNVSNYNNFSIISNNSNITNSHFEPMVQVYHNNYHNQNKVQIMPKMQNQNIGMQPLNSSQHSLNHSTIIYPSNEYYNKFEINQINQRQSHQVNKGNNIEYNNIGHINNPQNCAKPMDNIESEEDNEDSVCIII